MAVNRFLPYPLHITLVGRAEGEEAHDSLNASLDEGAPAKIVELVDPVRARLSAAV